MSLRSPLGRVRGLGSAKEGVGHWWMQRLTSIALAPLAILFVLLCLHLLNANYVEVRDMVANPLVAVLLLSFMISLYYHGMLGLQVVIEDYVHQRWMEISLLIAVRFSAFLLGAASVLAILRIVLQA